MDTSLLQSTHPELSVDWVEVIDSTQSRVKPNGLLIAEHQIAGIGRRGNSWLTVKNRSVCFSLRLNLALSISDLTGYALTVAVAVLETILKYEPSTHALLKWPNDLYVDNKKFGGILINLTPQNQQSTDVTIGIGINWSLQEEQLNSINQPVANVPIDALPKRVEFINELIGQIKLNNQQFLVGGLASFMPLWQKYDYLSGKQIIIKQNEKNTHGYYAGVDSSGQLKAMVNNQLKTFSAAEVSIRNHV